MPSPDLREQDTKPHRASAFERVTHRLGLLPSQYAESTELKAWVRQNKDEKYVPPHLLELWGLEVNVDIGASAKRPKRAA